MTDNYEKIGRNEIVKLPEIWEADAILSEDRKYRYALWRHWGASRANKCAFVMLNPSTADETTDDATIRKCMGFAVRWGYSGFYVVNLFSFRATRPKDLLAAEDRYGPAHLFNTQRILDLEYVRGVVCAWGSHGVKISRLVQQAQQHLVLPAYAQCLGYAKDGAPRHPLMLSYDTPLQPFKG